ncbi:MAG: hypothetical protein GY859_14725, partial [Desulfobacterales bacterium]|nr:hypothetical protein [Desulfobacterales bacterium]
PRPYYDYVSDWGGREWSAAKRRSIKPKKAPWVMVGYVRKEPEPGRHYSYTPHPKYIKRDNELQKEVSKELGKIIHGLFTRYAKGEMPVRLNCTNAWLNWYHPADRQILSDIIEIVEEKRGSKKSLANLKMIDKNWTV